MEKFPALCRKCPVLPGPILFNYTETINEKSCPKNTQKNIPTLVSGSWFPDGDYRTSIRLYSRDDSEVFHVNYYFRIKTGDTKAW